MAGVLGAAVGDPAFEKDHGGSRRFSDSTFAKADAKEREEDDYRDLVQSAMENTPSVSGGQASATGASRTENGNGNGVGGSGRMTLLERALETRDPDNERLLAKIRQRLDRVGIPLKTVVVRFEDLYIEADVRVGKRALPTLINSVRNVVEDILGNLRILPRPKVKLPILQNISGILKPGRMTLLLGPPSSGKSVLLRALAGKSDPGLRIDGTVTYNGHTFKEFYVQRTAAYVDQVDNHIGEMSVRETIDFAGRCQGAVFNNDVLSEMQRKEKEMGIEPDPDIDDFLMAAAAKSDMHNVMTDYVIKILGLDVCAETVVGNEMLRGISGGQKKRVTTAEMIVGPKRALFMDEISTGLDSSTTFQITTCLRNFTHHMDGTVLIALLQPAPETYDLFDDVMLLAEGHIVYHGPRERVLEFFSSIGFCCPDRKGVADFLQEVTSRKDQAQYWSRSTPYRYLTPNELSIAFSGFPLGAMRDQELTAPFDKTKSLPDALVKKKYALNIKEVLNVMYWREMILLKRMKFLYVFIIFQVSYLNFAVATTFVRTRMGTKSVADGNLYLAVIFFALINVMFSGFSEMAIIIQRLGVFYKQRDNFFYPGWSFAAPTWVLRFPNSLMEATICIVIVYYSTGLTPEPGRFFTLWLVLIVVHQMALGMFRLISAVCRTMTIANTFGSFSLLVIFVLGGFILARPNIPDYWLWGFYISPLAYAQNAAAVNEFTAKRWNTPLDRDGKMITIGKAVLSDRGLFTEYKWVWIGIGSLVGFGVVLNVLVVIALTLFNAIGKPQAVIPEDVMAEKLETRRQHSAPPSNVASRKSSLDYSNGGGELTAGSRSQQQHQTEPVQPSIPEDYGTTKSKGLSLPGSDVELAEPRPQRWEGYLETAHAGDPSQGVMEMGEDEEPPTSPEALAKAEFVQDATLFKKQGGEVPKRGMILPFRPLAMSFHHLWYYVTLPEGNEEFGIEKKGRLPLLRDVSGAFRPGVLTALVGVSGAGKTTLMDVLAGRKTSGEIEGDIWVANYPKEQHSFARVSGYCEQFDTHSPCTTVREALIFSAWLRLPPEVDEATRKVFVDEVMDLTELTPLRNALVGLPGINGLSVEQRKRLTIAVELVANPSIIFMDEPTSGLDARAAAVVMRAVRNTVDTGRTVVCTIHQPSIDIFESFDELLLMKRGGQIIFNGLLGKNSCELIKYFESVPGVPKCPSGHNPATWMLEISTQGMERQLQVDFADLYIKSSLHKSLEKMVVVLGKPSADSKPLSFETKRSRGEWTQYCALLWKNNKSYWRNPNYNTVRFIFTVAIALVFGSVFFNQGMKRTDPQSLFNIMGALYAATLFQGFSNTNAVQPVFAIERTVMYRERAAGMYSAMPFAAAAVTIEIPYVLMQAIWYSLIVYSLIGFEWTAAKFLWFFLYMFLTLVVFTMYGMMMVSLTPNAQVGAVVSSLAMGLWNLFSGFLIPASRIPGWWIWFYYINPLAWVLYGMIVSQLGDVTEIIKLDGDDKEVRQYVEDFFSFKYELVWLPAVVLTGMLVLFVVVTAHATRKFNFQKR